MPVGPVELFKIESEDEADYYLTELLRDPENRSMTEVLLREQEYVKDPRVKVYFINKAKEMLAAYGQ